MVFSYIVVHILTIFLRYFVPQKQFLFQRYKKGQNFCIKNAKSLVPSQISEGCATTISNRGMLIAQYNYSLLTVSNLFINIAFHRSNFITQTLSTNRQLILPSCVHVKCSTFIFICQYLFFHRFPCKSTRKYHSNCPSNRPRPPYCRHSSKISK